MDEMQVMSCARCKSENVRIIEGEERVKVIDHAKVVGYKNVPTYSVKCENCGNNSGEFAVLHWAVGAWNTWNAQCRTP